MTLRIIGALVLCLGSSVVGFTASGNVRKTVKMLQDLKLSLEMMRCEISFTLTPASKICELLSCSSNGAVKTLYEKLADYYATGYHLHRVTTDCIVRQVLRNVPPEVECAMSDLAESFGRFGVQEQLRLIDMTVHKVTAALTKLDAEKKQRCRCYETLGICTGLAIAVLVL